MSGSHTVLFLQHQDDCPPGYVGDRMRARGARVKVARVRRDPLPPPTDVDLIVSLGSDDAAYDETVPYLDREWEFLDAAVEAGVPVFGICFGAQLLSLVLGGRVHQSPSGPEIGWLSVDSREPDLVDSGPWLIWHLDAMAGAPPGGTEVASTTVGTQVFTHGPHVGVQFHPEATVDSVEIWAGRYRDSVLASGLDPAQVVAETKERDQLTRRRAYRLTDRVLARAEALTTR